VFLADGDWTASIARFRGTMTGPMKGADGSEIPPTGKSDAHGQSHDVPGAALVTSGLVLLVLGITQGRQWEWTSTRTIGVFAAATVLLAAFVLWSGGSATRSCPSRSSRCRP
jgi:hypothetical protein